MDPIDAWVDAVALRKLAESLLAPAPQREVEQTEAAYGTAFVGFERAVAVASPDTPLVEEARELSPVVESQARAALAGAREAAERGGLLADSRQAPAREIKAAPLAAPGLVSSAAVAVAERAPVSKPMPATPEPRQAVTPPATPPMGASHGLFLERLRAYGRWLHDAVGAKAFFVCNREGDTLIDEVNAPKLLHVARTLAHASWTANRQAGSEPVVGSLHVKLGSESIMEVLPINSRYGPLVLGIVVPSLLPAPTVEVVASSLQRVVNGPVQSS